MIYPFFFPVDVHECSHNHAIGCSQQICGFQIEVLGVEVIGLLEVRDQPSFESSKFSFHGKGSHEAYV